MVKDSQPIRSCSFSPDNDNIFVIGTNSKSLKFCRLPVSGTLDYQDGYTVDYSQPISTVLDLQDYHDGSIYCIDWSKQSRLVATGSNDKMIKIMVAPAFSGEESGSSRTSSEDIIQLELAGHKGVVRTVVFNPVEPR